MLMVLTEGSIGGSCPSNVSYNSVFIHRLAGYKWSALLWWTTLTRVVFGKLTLSQSQITALYNSGSGTTNVPTTDLKAHFDFDDTGSTLTQ